jgi:sugar/nucleoside kinase (ribokinase family)
VPEAYRDSKYVFLANTTPGLQIQLLEQVQGPDFVAADTMDCWIKDDFDDLKKLLEKIDCLILNDGEARMLADDYNLIKAAEKILGMGPGVVIIKKGESGSLICKTGGKRFILPAYPAAEVKDPTGAGDSFAGGLMGYLTQAGKTDFDSLKKAVAYGTVVASFAIADFSLAGLTSISKTDIDGRLETLREVTSF